MHRYASRESGQLRAWFISLSRCAFSLSYLLARPLAAEQNTCLWSMTNSLIMLWRQHYQHRYALYVSICEKKPSEMNDLDNVAQKEIRRRSRQRFTAICHVSLSLLHEWTRTFECLLKIAYKQEIKKWKALVDDKKAIYYSLTEILFPIEVRVRTIRGLLIAICQKPVVVVIQTMETQPEDSSKTHPKLLK